MQFKDIIGQTHTANHLTQIADSGRISHAQLLVGNSSAGTLALALAYAQYINCSNPQHYTTSSPEALRADSCGCCPNCKKYQQLSHADLHLVFPTATTSTVKSNPTSDDFQQQFRQFVIDTHGTPTLDDWYTAMGIENKQGLIRERDADNIIKILSLKPYESTYKVVVVWMAEKMNLSMANKLLKTLEEPASKTLIILTAENTDRILPTILSRTQTIRVPDAHSSQKVYAGNIALSSETAEAFAPLFVTWMRQLFKLNMASLSAWVDNIAAYGREQQKQFLLFAQEGLRQCFLAHAAAIPLKMDFHDEKFNASFPAMITPRNIEKLDQAFNDALFAIERNAHPKITFMELSFAISRQLKKR